MNFGRSVSLLSKSLKSADRLLFGGVRAQSQVDIVKPADALPLRQQQEPEKRDISLISHSMGYFFNTHSAVKNLQNCGFSLEEAEAIAELLTQIILAQSDSHVKNFISKQQLEISVQQLLAQIDSVKKDMSILEKSQFANLRHDLEKISMTIKQVDNKLVDELSKMNSSFALDMNLERSRAKEDHHNLSREVQALTNRIAIETANMQTEMANVKAYMEKSKSDTFKYVGGIFVSTGLTVAFIIYRTLTMSSST